MMPMDNRAQKSRWGKEVYSSSLLTTFRLGGGEMEIINYFLPRQMRQGVRGSINLTDGSS